jgi:hypothetical protein
MMFLSILLSVLVLAYVSVEQGYVLAPALTCSIIVLWLWMILWERDQEIPLVDIGFICALATLFYIIYPLFNYLINDLNFGYFGDYRLERYQITPAQLGAFHLRHVLYLSSFVIIYSAFRGKGNLKLGNVQIPDRSTQQAILILFLVLSGYFLILKILTGLNFNTSYEPEAYSSNRAIFANAPYLLVQISGKLGGILFLLKIALLFIIISKCKRLKWRVVLLIWIALEIIIALRLGGARTGLVLFLMATVILYHRIISNISFKYLMLMGSLLFILFIFMGVYRSYSDFSLFKLDMPQTNAGFFSVNNEFQALLGTSYDVFQLKKSGVILPWYLYVNDIINILPPQQLLPFEKIPASEWYLREIGLNESGIGYMWGVISQSIVGLDWIELILRGSILGYILARLHRWYLKRQSGFLENLFYIYLCLKIYYTFRDTTFSILSNFVWEILPFYFIMRLVAGSHFVSLYSRTNQIEYISNKNRI